MARNSNHLVARSKLTTVLAGVLATTLACGACSSSTKSTTGSSGTTTAPTSASAASGPIPNVNGQLLTLADLPAGWSVDNSPDTSSSTPKCFQDAKDPTTNAKAKAKAKFQGGSNGIPALEEGIAYLPGQAQKVMTEFAQVMSGCGQIKFTDSGHTFTGSIGQMSFPNLGQQTEPYQVNLSTSASGLTLTLGLDLIAIRQGDEIALIYYGDLGTPDINQVQQFAQKAISKV